MLQLSLDAQMKATVSTIEMLGFAGQTAVWILPYGVQGYGGLAVYKKVCRNFPILRWIFTNRQHRGDTCL